MPSPLARFPLDLEELFPARHVRFDDLLAPAGSGDEGTQGEGHTDQSGTTGAASHDSELLLSVVTPGTTTPAKASKPPSRFMVPSLLLIAGRTPDLGGTFTPFQRSSRPGSIARGVT